MTLPQVPTPAGIPSHRGIENFKPAPKPIHGTATDPSRLKALEKAVKQAKPMRPHA